MTKTKSRYRDFPVRSSSLETIVERFAAYRPGMSDFVEWFRNSKYAYGLFAVTSLDTLVLGQSDAFDFNRNVIRVQEVGTKFLLTLRESETYESTREFEKSELIPAFERLLTSLHWFAENEIVNEH